MERQRAGPSGGDSPGELRDQFIGWQCRLRQLAVREHAGQPSDGMKPRVSANSDAEGETIVDQLVILIVLREPEETTAHLRHLFRRTQDPRDRHSQVLALLRAGHYQYPNRFSDAMTALFSPGSQRAQSLLEMGSCVLHFEQYGRAYRVPCTVQSLEQEDAAYQATLHHNTVFNPAVPPDPEILSFAPDWSRASTWETTG